MKRSPCYLLVLLAVCLQISSAFVPSNFAQQTSNINHQKSQPQIATLKKQSTSSALHISIGNYASSSIGTISTTLSSILPTTPLRRQAKLLLLLLTTVTTFIIASKKKSSLLWPGTHVSSSSDSSDEYPLPPGSFGCPFIGYDLFRYVVSSWYIVCVMIFVFVHMICSTFCSHDMHTFLLMLTMICAQNIIYLIPSVAVPKIMDTWQRYTNYHVKWQIHLKSSNHTLLVCQ